MDKDFKKICCSNCRHTGPFSKGCEKFKELCEKEGCGYAGDISTNLDRWEKRHQLEMDYNCDDFENRWLQYPIPVKEVEQDIESLKKNSLTSLTKSELKYYIDLLKGFIKYIEPKETNGGVMEAIDGIKEFISRISKEG